MIFRTESGSSYEVDQPNNKIRRLYGKLPSTDRVGQDGEWKSFHSLSQLIIGRPVIIVWGFVDDGLGKIAQSTCTSFLSEIVREDQLS